MKKAFTKTILLAAIINISGCDEKGSVKWYMDHHDEMFKKFGDCLFYDDRESDGCKNARKAVIEAQVDNPEVRKRKNKVIRDTVDRKIQTVPDLNNLGSRRN